MFMRYRMVVCAALVLCPVQFMVSTCAGQEGKDGSLRKTKIVDSAKFMLTNDSGEEQSITLAWTLTPEFRYVSNEDKVAFVGKLPGFGKVATSIQLTHVKKDDAKKSLDDNGPSMDWNPKAQYERMTQPRTSIAPGKVKSSEYVYYSVAIQLLEKTDSQSSESSEVDSLSQFEAVNDQDSWALDAAITVRRLSLGCKELKDPKELGNHPFLLLDIDRLGIRSPNTGYVTAIYKVFADGSVVRHDPAAFIIGKSEEEPVQVEYAIPQSKIEEEVLK